MKQVAKMTLAALAAGALTVASTSAFAGHHCKKVSGEGTGALVEIAKDQALWQLSDTAAKSGGKLSGGTSMSCKIKDGIMHVCVATQKLCK